MKKDACTLKDALMWLFRRHVGMQEKFADIFGDLNVLHFRNWGEMYMAVQENDLLVPLTEIPGSSTERTLVAVILAKLGFTAMADRMLGDRSMGRLADLDWEQWDICHAIMTSR